MNKFLYDLTKAIPFEQRIAMELKGIWNDTIRNDHGVDVIGPDGKTYDVKAYRKPLFIKRFDGVFVETASRDGRLGWINNPDKINTHYILLVNCDEPDNYEEAYLITRKRLQILGAFYASHGGKIIQPTKETGGGVIVPYDAILKLSEDYWRG